MVSVGALPLRFRWPLALCIAAVMLTLAGHLISDATVGSPDLVTADAHSREGRFGSSRVETCDLMGESALPAMAGIAGLLQPVVFPLNDPSLDRAAWFSPPPVRPPILIAE
jgi:hypothetical protein